MKPGDIVSYIEMCQVVGVNLQRGMNYRLKGNTTIILMSVRLGAPYSDRVEENGRVLIYEGHDVPRNEHVRPKTVDQTAEHLGGSLTQNGMFSKAAKEFKEGKREPEQVKVFEKIRAGVWAFNGLFRLIDAWKELSGKRSVFKFKLELTDQVDQKPSNLTISLSHNRMISTDVKLAVWKRDKGICVQCGSHDNLHFDHIIPFSKGGSSLMAENIQLLCARHNLAKHDRIE